MRMRLQKRPRRMTWTTTSSLVVTSPLVRPDRPGQQEGTQSWQAKAMTAYTRTVEDRELLLRARLAGRVQTLTGRVLAKEEIAVDCTAWRAMAVVDGVLFHLGERELTVLRPCAHCETGCFKSPPIVSQDDLGYVLATWQPYHEECQPTDAPDDVSW